MIWSPRRAFTVLTSRGSPPRLQGVWNWHPLWTGGGGAWKKSGQGFGGGVFQSRPAALLGHRRIQAWPSSLVDDLLALKNPTVAPYAGAGEVKLPDSLPGLEHGRGQPGACSLPVERSCRERHRPASVSAAG